MINVREILYATDFSPQANQAYFHAIALAEAHRARLTVVHVYEPPALPAGAVLGLPLGMQAMEEEKQELFSQLEQIHPLNPRTVVRHALLEGSPAEEIVRHAAALRADLIVIGTHGRTGLDRLVMGSVAEKVLSDATCSVMVIKMPRARSLQ
jgi:nucleotide-binding universal stress UspA family protein